MLQDIHDVVIHSTHRIANWNMQVDTMMLQLNPPAKRVTATLLPTLLWSWAIKSIWTRRHWLLKSLWNYKNTTAKIHVNSQGRDSLTLPSTRSSGLNICQQLCFMAQILATMTWAVIAFQLTQNMYQQTQLGRCILVMPVAQSLATCWPHC